MPKFRVNMDTTYKGAIFNSGMTQAAAGRAVTAINEGLAEEARRRILAHLNTVLQNPTGYYESKITVNKRGVSRWVSDSNVIYGGWLEGVSSRNRTTRFKGYRTFRLVKQSMQRDAEALARPYVDRLVGEMNK